MILAAFGRKSIVLLNSWKTTYSNIAISSILDSKLIKVREVKPVSVRVLYT